MKNWLLISACLLLVIASGCSKGTAATAKAPAATTQLTDYKTSLDKLCGDILQCLVDVETETNGDRVTELDKRIKADFAKCPKAPTTNDNSDVIREHAENAVSMFGAYCDYMAIAITKEKRGGADSAKTEREDASIMKMGAKENVDKLRQILAEIK